MALRVYLTKIKVPFIDLYLLIKIGLFKSAFKMLTNTKTKLYV
jgi:hypothetical protein